MKNESNLEKRLQFLVRVVRKECRHLATTDQRLFGAGLSLQQVAALDSDLDLAERVEAFVGRFGRLQDTIGDKLLSSLLVLLGERPSAAIDNLDRAERLGFVKSTESWMAMRALRNQMVHEYVEDPVLLHGALQAGHAFVSELLAAGDAMTVEVEKRLGAG